MVEVHFQLLIWVCSILSLISISLGFDPPDNYLINCGSLTNASVDSRIFMADNTNSNVLSTPEAIFVNTSTNSIPSSYAPDLCRTARVLTRTSHFTFSISKHGRHWIRIHFFPFVSQKYDLNKARFSVFVQNVTLLRDFLSDSGPVVKEYSLNVTSDKLVITFSPSENSFVFLNGLEVVSVPDELVPDSVASVDQQGSEQNLVYQALETVYRVNMGNKTVNPQNDTLSRVWVADEPFLKHSNLVEFVSKESAVNYTNGGPTPEIAPLSVYGTASKLDSEADPNINANVTWLFSVDRGFGYFVRFHFCDIVSKSPGQLVFNVYINSWSVKRHLDLSKETSNVLGAPFYLDVALRVSDTDTLSVSVGPSNDGGTYYPNALLNGLEIMKMNNSKGSLDASDSDFASSKTSSMVKIGIIVGSAIGGLLLILLISLIIFLVIRRRKRACIGLNGGYGNGINSEFGYQFSLVAIRDATSNFSENLVIGVGGFGKVYKGVLKDERKVAVKRGNPNSQQGLREFHTEIEMLSHFRHRHLVSLIGYCDEQNEMILIYEYMENGTLKSHLYGSDHPILSWKQRLEICVGAARGLHYLHTGSAKPIIHRDVKSANILLDENFMAKVADFGLSKAGPEIDKTHVTTAVKGSFGYLDPEYLIRQQLTEKSDVYSFGVVLFEVLCGRPVIDPSQQREMVNLVEWALKWQKKGELDKIVDPQLISQIQLECFRKFGETAEKCLSESSIDRPTMGEVLWNLEYILQLQLDDGSGNDNSDNTLHVVDINAFERNVSAAKTSLGSADELVDASMSQVFSQMMKAEVR